MSEIKNVFLTYSEKDKSIVKKIIYEIMHKANVKIHINDSESYLNGNLFLDKMRYNIENSEYVIIFISDSFNSSKYANNELVKTLNDFHNRNIKIIPVIINKCRVPSELLNYEVINLQTNYENGIEKIANKIDAYQHISFNQITGKEFEYFISIFLEEYGFKIINNEWHNDKGFDFTCEYIAKNPFGMLKKELWFVETKYYKDERFGINTLKELINYKRSILPNDSKMLLITNSIFTSITKEFLLDMQKQENTQIDVIDGPLLERLIIKRKKLLKKYNELIK